MTRAQLARVTAILCLLAGWPIVVQAEPALTRQQQVRAEGAGGATTVHRFDTSAFSLPASNLGITRRTRFFAGNSFFTQPWIPGPASTSARDGLGPLFNTNTCQSCHLKDGRGRPPEGDEPMISMLVRISVALPGAEPEALRRAGVVPHPAYGEQLQTHGIAGVRSEASPRLRWSEIAGTFTDGTPYGLIRPALDLAELGYGEPGEAARFSLRVAPALVGMGLLEAIPEEQLLARADPDDRDGDGISGRPNRVWSREHTRTELGRFGWKAGQPSVRQQVAAAFAGDLGVTSRLFPEPDCSPAQAGCARSAGSSSELGDEILDLVTFYVSLLGVPDRRTTNAAASRRGEQLFEQLGCERCHARAFTTGDQSDLPELHGQKIRPYTDLLLHDMGAGLADDRPEFEATGREWRTPPLWGIGLIEIVSRHTRFLHDGRARNLEEAILWHGGEAERARDAYRALPASERAQLLFFLRSL